jgi:hypothetical protein
MLCPAPAWSAEAEMLRFRAATILTADLQEFAEHYGRYLDYRVRERGRIDAGLARAWGARRMQGRPYLLLSPDTAPDVFIRAIQGRPDPAFSALTTHGWGAVEIVVRDPDAMRQKFAGGPFRIIGEPANLSGYPSIRAFQAEGPSGEVLYLTAETGDRSRSPLPDPLGEVGRIFIMVLAGPDIHALNDWYARSFGLSPGRVNDRPVGVVGRAQNLPAGATIPLTTIRLAQHGNLLELDGYPPAAAPRKIPRGELPAGIAITTVAVRSLAALPLKYLSRPARRAGALYGDRRTATVRGPAGEWLELIEDP